MIERPEGIIITFPVKFLIELGWSVLRTKYQLAYEAGWEPGGEKEFSDSRKRTAKHWLLLCNPIIRIPDIPFKGFQGFRYTQKLF